MSSQNVGELQPDHNNRPPLIRSNILHASVKENFSLLMITCYKVTLVYVKCNTAEDNELHEAELFLRRP
jgi:hypothetical protein